MMAVPQRFQAACEMCGDPLDIRKPGVHQFVSGWIENRKGGGAHAIRMAQRVQRYACKFCVDREMAGAARWQPSLFG